jgi:hypothetical protein
MKNFSPDFYFEQSITIVNTLKDAPPAAAPAPAAYGAQFFPEGGNLVAGLVSTVACKLLNKQGEGVIGRGVILNRQKDTVARFQTYHAGMGRFSFTPQKGNEYSAVVYINDTVLLQQLPAVYDQGFTLHLAETNKDQLQVTVAASAGLSGMPVYLLAHTRQLVKSVQNSALSDGRAVFTLDKNILGDGISHITLFDAGRRPVCERLYFKRPAAGLLIHATADQTAYATRKKVTLQVQTEDGPGHATPANLSLSVFLLDSLQSLQYTDMAAYLLLTSDIKGRVEDPAYYFNHTDATGDTAADDLMLTQGWRRFRWEAVLQDSRPLFDYLPEKEGTIINARVTDRHSGQPVKNAMTWLSVPGQSFVVGTAAAHANGDLHFNMGNFYGHNEIIAQTNPRTDSSCRVDITAPWSDKFSANPFPAYTLSPQWKNQLEYRSINAQADNSYRLKEKDRVIIPARADTTLFYGRPDKQYYLDDYTRFSTMEEVMHEYVAEVRVRKPADTYNFRVVNLYFKAFFDDDPLVLLDGVPVFDASRIMAMDPLKIKKIDVVLHKYYYGPFTADGIVSYTTYEGNLTGYTLDPNAVVVEYEGLQRAREFYAPAYETTEAAAGRVPDTRNALHWAPQLKTGEKGGQSLSFYTSDLKGRYAVVVQGISPAGLPGSAVFTFEVH